MFKFSIAWKTLVTFIVLFYAVSVHSKEYLLEADVDARTEYNDNLFLTDQEHDAVKGIIITPSLAGFIKEENWQAYIQARLRSQNYSDSDLSGNDQLFDLTGKYNLERNIFSVNISHNLDSNLSSSSTDFGTIVGQRVDRKSQSITPQYTRLITERLVLQLSYTYSDVDFIDAEDTGFVPYILQSGTGAFIYDFTERDKITFSLSAVDYASRNELVTYQLFQTRIGIDHEFSETLSGDFAVGVSRQDTTNLQTQTFDFFGQPITISQEIDSNNRGLVFDAGIKQILETGKFEGRISRSDRTNSFGGLDVVNAINIIYTDKLTQLWRYIISSRYEDIKSVSTSTNRTDRETFYLNSVVYYSINRNWDISASYRYTARKFSSDTSNNRAPHSNRIYFGLTYNFPSLSTY